MLLPVSCTDLKASSPSFSFQISQVILRMQLLQHLLGDPHKNNNAQVLCGAFHRCLQEVKYYFTEAARAEAWVVQQQNGLPMSLLVLSHWAP